MYTSLEELCFPSKLLDNRGESILLADSGANQELILCFGVARHNRLIQESGVILGDGTFQICPNSWKQQYSLHMITKGFTIPALFFLVPGKTKVLRSRLLRIVQDLAPGVEIKTWCFDFEATRRS